MKREEEEEEAIESVESDTACSLWEQKKKQKLEKCVNQNKQVFSRQKDNVNANTVDNSLRLRPTH